MVNKQATVLTKFRVLVETYDQNNEQGLEQGKGATSSKNYA